jgi:hypothetical protein
MWHQLSATPDITQFSVAHATAGIEVNWDCTDEDIVAGRQGFPNGWEL